MIEDFIEWKQNQEPFVDDRNFFIQRYGVEPNKLTVDLVKEIFFLRKEIFNELAEIKEILGEE